MESKSIQLKDQRRLGYGEYGKPDGTPIMYFHGTPGCRFLPSYDIQVAQEVGVRVLVPERPGFGHSDAKAGRTLLDWADDVLELADQLGIERFSIIGVSAGGPYAAACAFKIPKQLHLAAIVSSASPSDAEGVSSPFTLAETETWVTGLAENFHRDPAGFYDGIVASIPESSPDRAAFDDSAMREFLPAIYAETFRNGPQHMIQDLTLGQYQPWGFPLEDIKANVHIWHGDVDETFALAQGLYLSKHIPNAKFHVLAGKGHFVPGLMGDIFKFILAN